MNPFEKFTQFRKKKLCLIHELNFLLKCRDHNVIPNFISNQIKKFRHHGYHVRKCFSRNLGSLLRAAIKDTRSKLAKHEMELYSLHLNLSKTFHQAVWERLDVISFAVASSHADKKAQTLEKKFYKLIADESQPPSKVSSQSLLEPSVSEDFSEPSIPELNQDIVINKSSVTLTEEQTKALQLGLNFAIQPNIKNDSVLEDLVCDLDYGIEKSVSKDVKCDLKSCVKTIISKFPPSQSSNFNPFKCLKDLSKQDVYVMKSDKGGRTVILDKNTYDKALDDIVSDSDVYSEVKQGPITNIVNDLKDRIGKCVSLDKHDKVKLIPSTYNLPRIYALPKIHKAGMPFRPIVSNVNSVLHPTAKFVNSKLNFLGSSNKYTVKNSTAFVERIRNVKLNKNDILVSFDVKSLFTNVPADEALDVLNKKLLDVNAKNLTPVERTDLVNLASVCIDNTYFNHGDKTFRQNFGLAMGSPLSPLLADVFMDHIEDLVFKLDGNKPTTWIRYIDDVFAIWGFGLDALNTFVDKINSIHPHIQFTYEIENNGKLPFLDVMVERSGGSLSTSVYRKPMSVTAPPHALSCHPWSQKMSTFTGFVKRAFNVSSSEESLKLELNYLKAIAVDRGYDPIIIDRAARKHKNGLFLKSRTSLTSLKNTSKTFISFPFIPKLSNKIGRELIKHDIKPIYKPYMKAATLFSNHKTKIPKERLSGVYSINCKDCDNIYIGQTIRSFYRRKSEHQSACGCNPRGRIKKDINTDKSAVALHIDTTKHQINWDEAKVIKHCKNHLLNIFEMLYIFKNQQKCMNRKDDNKFPSTWRSLFK